MGVRWKGHVTKMSEVLQTKYVNGSLQHNKTLYDFDTKESGALKKHLNLTETQIIVTGATQGMAIDYGSIDEVKVKKSLFKSRLLLYVNDNGKRVEKFLVAHADALLISSSISALKQMYEDAKKVGKDYSIIEVDKTSNNAHAASKSMQIQMHTHRNAKARYDISELIRRDTKIKKIAGVPFSIASNKKTAPYTIDLAAMIKLASFGQNPSAFVHKNALFNAMAMFAVWDSEGMTKHLIKRITLGDNYSSIEAAVNGIGSFAYYGQKPIEGNGEKGGIDERFLIFKVRRMKKSLAKQHSNLINNYSDESFLWNSPL